VNAVTTTPGVESKALRSSSFADRLFAALPLASIYVWLCGLYAVEAWRRVTPWLFTDELKLAQASRAIATGHAPRPGQPNSPDSLYLYLTAPMWLIHDVAKAYSAIKYADVFVMASVVFPTYLLARLLVGRRVALFAAAGAGAIPSLAYSSYIVEEPLAYPYAALCFFLIAKAFIVHGGARSRRWAAAAIVASAVAPAVRGELVMVPATLGLALLFAAWSSDAGRRWRSTWSIGDWVGTVVLVLGAIFLVSGVASHHSLQWLTITRAYKHRIIVQGDWAVGSLAIGLGVVPLVAGLAALFRSPGEKRSNERRMFRSVALAGYISFGLYTAMKAAYLSTAFATRVEERNLIYVAPLLFVGTALVLERRRINVLALAAATAYAVYLVAGTPYFMDRQLYSDALGLALVEQANRYIGWTPDIAQNVLLAITVFGAAALFLVSRLRERVRVSAALAAVLAVGVVGWSLTGEISAAAGTNSISHAAGATLRHPFDWVDTRTHGARTIYLGEGVADPNAPYLIAFWNRSITTMASLDGTLTGPLAAGSPNLSARGELLYTNYDYAVEDWPCVDFAGTKHWRHAYRAGGTFRVWRLVQLTHPALLRAMCTGIYPDGWSGASDSAYYRFSGSAGWLRVTYSRRDWGYASGPSPVRVQLGKLLVDANHQPTLGKVRTEIEGMIDSKQTKTLLLRVPAGGFAVRVVVDKKFVPHDFNPGSGDRRELGAEVSYRFFTARPATPHR
jgi:hypothetical protein